MRATVVTGPKLMAAIDPGGMTGMLVFRPRLDPEQPSGYGIEPIEWIEERDQVALCDRLWKMSTARLASERLHGIVIERWTPREGVRTFQPEALEIIGFCRWLMGGDPARFFMQNVADANAYGTDTKTRPYRRPPYSVGVGGEGHARMALKHALLWVGTRWTPEETP